MLLFPQRFLLSLLLVAASSPILAQVGEARHELSIGVNAGAALNKVDFDPSISQTYHVGPVIGFTFRYMSERYFNTYCALQMELNYAQMGWKENVLDANANPLPDTYERNLSYLQLPVMARLGWGKEKRGLMFYFLAGPQIGYCIGESSKKSETWTLDANGNPDRPNGMYLQYDMKLAHKIDYGITAGIGLELNTKVGHFMIEGRYYYGLSDLFGNAKKDVFSRSANGTIYIKTAYLFNLTK